jgi:hypothetical protein
MVGEDNSRLLQAIKTMFDHQLTLSLIAINYRARCRLSCFPGRQKHIKINMDLVIAARVVDRSCEINVTHLTLLGLDTNHHHQYGQNFGRYPHSGEFSSLFGEAVCIAK